MTASPVQSLDYAVLQQCMHCGLCLPTCPTYVETGRERNSPRGRIALMRAIADGELGTSRAFAEEMDYCLGCLACVTACPAGVDYATLFETARSQVEQSGVRATLPRRLIRFLSLRVLFLRPRLLRSAGRMLWFYQASGVQSLIRRIRIPALLPRRWRDLESLTPAIRRQFSDALIAPVERPRAPIRQRWRVAVLTGCLQDLILSEVNRATVEVLVENGCEVTTPRAQSCCGSLHAHSGDPEGARILARRQLDAIDPERFDAIISNAAGCGSHLKHYGRLLAEDPAYAARAQRWSEKVKDISEWLVEIGFRRPAGRPSGDAADTVLTYHEACHLCHGQKVSAAPREILRSLPGAALKECAESTWCCGSAGVYNLTQPRTAQWLLERKLGHLEATGAAVIALGNPGCQLQIESGLRAAGTSGVRVAHPVLLLAEAYRAERAAN
jgi:glycolate oxidase iron-sulfur subunit